jgi:hypothetical protein
MENRNHQDEIVKNMEKCPHFQYCSRNLCILDWKLSLRTGNKNDRCRYMREPKVVRIQGREFVSGGAVAPDTILNFTPTSNLEGLNTSSKTRLEEIKQLTLKK